MQRILLEQHRVALLDDLDRLGLEMPMVEQPFEMPSASAFPPYPPPLSRYMT